MSTYDYRCTSCGHEFEEFQSIKDVPVKDCPVCNARVKRIINGGAGLIFKGSGFYITDYKNGSNGNGKKTIEPTPKKNDNSKNDSSKDKKSDSSKSDSSKPESDSPKKS